MWCSRSWPCSSVGPDCERTTWLATKRSLGSAKRSPVVAGSVSIRGACRRGKPHIAVESVKALERAHPEVEGVPMPGTRTTARPGASRSGWKRSTWRPTRRAALACRRAEAHTCGLATPAQGWAKRPAQASSSPSSPPSRWGRDIAREIAGLRSGLPVVISSGCIPEEMPAVAGQPGVRRAMQGEYTPVWCGIACNTSPEQLADIPQLVLGKPG
jgi:hypothetical protein